MKTEQHHKLLWDSEINKKLFRIQEMELSPESLEYHLSGWDRPERGSREIAHNWAERSVSVAEGLLRQSLGMCETELQRNPVLKFCRQMTKQRNLICIFQGKRRLFL